MGMHEGQGVHHRPVVHLLEPSSSSQSVCCPSPRRRLPSTPQAPTSNGSTPSPQFLTTTCVAPPASPSYHLTHHSMSQTNLLPGGPNISPHRRSSTPRLLPTPPPASPESRAPSCCMLERRPSGRLLPQPPAETFQHFISGAPLATPDPRITPDPDMPRAEESSPSVEPIGDVADDLASETESGIDRGDGELLGPSCASAASSIDQLNSKSSGGGSDVEDDRRDPRDHGIDPSHYLPGAPIMSPHNGRSLSISSAHSAIAGSLNGGIQGATVASSSSFNGSDGGPKPHGLGLLQCTMQHFPVRKRLRVNILKIEGLAGQLKPDMEMHAQCKVSIPGLKGGKEQGSEVKRGRNPVYNQEFFFDNVTAEDLDTRTLHIGAYHHGGVKLGKDILIGEVQIALREIRELNTKKEVKFIEELKQNLPKKLGKIHITSCVERDARRLTVNIKKAEDLPRWGFLGSPDVCVKITLVQGSGIAKTKCSRILKATTTAVYNEAVMFIFNPTKIELAHTKITISVHDMQRSCTGDDIIGCAYLGILAQDKTEMEQWKNTIDHMGKECKGTHHLKHPSLNPPTVRVADMTQEEEPEDEEEREEGFEF